MTASSLFTALVSRTNTTDYTTISNTSAIGKKRSIESKNNEIKKKNKNEIIDDTLLVASANDKRNEHKLFMPKVDEVLLLYHFPI